MVLAFGIILLLVPILLVFLYSNTFKDTIRMVAYIAMFHIGLSFLTQLLHIFYYPVVILANVAFVATLIYFLNKQKLIERSKLIEKIKKSFKSYWFVLPVLLVVVLQLLSIRYFYSGPVQTIKGSVQIENSTYVYPYYSDEWVTASLIKYTISNHTLPIVNPLDHNRAFPNILFVFPSTLSEFFLLIGLDSLTNYNVLQMLVVLVMLISFYLLTREYRLNSYISAVTILGFLYITNSGNLPAMWSLLPVTLSLVFLPWIIIAQRHGLRKWTLVFGFVSLVVYPPMMVFVLPILCVDLYKSYMIHLEAGSQKDARKFIKHVLSVVSLGVTSFILIFYVTFFHFGLSLSNVLSKYFLRPNLDPGIPDYFIWNILPIFILLLSAYGIYLSFKNKYAELLAPFFIGVIYWFTYLSFNKVFIIEYPRIVFVTSIFLIIFAGIGLEHLIKEFLDRNLLDRVKIKCNPSTHYLLVGLFFLLVCIVFLPMYATQNSWQELNLRVYDGTGKVHLLSPANPINRYLMPDDSRLFGGSKDVNFISLPWKGLVIGAVTHNFPLESKSSTITNQIYMYSNFMNSNCDQKKEVALKYKIKYVYSVPFSCPNFMEIGKSEEGLALSRFTL